MSPQMAQANDTLLYVLKKMLSVVVGVHMAEVVGRVRVMVDVPLDYAKYGQLREEVLFLNIAKVGPNLKEEHWRKKKKKN